MKTKRYAILIGNAIYHADPKITNLRCPINDINGLANVFQSTEIGRYDKILVLADKTNSELTLEISKTVNGLNPNDFIFIYYSGHGKISPANVLCLTTSNTNEQYLEATSLPIITLKLLLDAVGVNNIVIILDCCYGGAIRHSLVKGGVNDQLSATVKGQGRYIITAAAEIQMAEEKETDTYSVFTKHLIEGIETGNADIESTGTITADSLYGYVRKKVIQESRMSPLRFAEVAGDVVIAYSNKHSLDKERELATDIKSGLYHYIDCANNLHAAFSDHVTTILTEEKCQHDLIDAIEKYNSHVTKLLPKLVDQEMQIEKYWGEPLAQKFVEIHQELRICNSEKIKNINEVRELLNPLFHGNQNDPSAIEQAENVRKTKMNDVSDSLTRLQQHTNSFIEKLFIHRNNQTATNLSNKNLYSNTTTEAKDYAKV